MEKNKILYLLLFGIGLFAVLILAISLPQFRLQEGQPFPLNMDFSISVMGTQAILPGGNVLYWILRGMAALIFIGLPIYIIVSLFSPEGRRRLLVQIVILLVLIFILDRVAKIVQEKPKEEQVQSIETPAEQLQTGELNNTQTEQFAATTPEWMVWGSSIGVALFFTGLVALGLWFYYRRNTKHLTPSDRLAQEAKRAISDLQGGDNFKNVIIRVYYQMSQIIYSEQGIQRELAMTASEFEQALEEKGFPKEPIQYLTKIFEEVRYGTKQPAKSEEDKAIWYLSVIADASKDSRIGSQA
jgi:hypothetical protein